MHTLRDDQYQQSLYIAQNKSVVVDNQKQIKKITAAIKSDRNNIDQIKTAGKLEDELADSTQMKIPGGTPKLSQQHAKSKGNLTIAPNRFPLPPVDLTRATAFNNSVSEYVNIGLNRHKRRLASKDSNRQDAQIYSDGEVRTPKK